MIFLKKNNRDILLNSLISLFSLSPIMAFAHGSIEYPMSRILNCRNEIRGDKSSISHTKSQACVDVIKETASEPRWKLEQGLEWQSVRQGGPVGGGLQHTQVIPDGKLCSGGDEKYHRFDVGRKDWLATDIFPNASGKFELSFALTMSHKTSYIRSYISKDSYDPTQSLKWSDLEQYCQVADFDKSSGSFKVTCPFPKGKIGKHVMYTIWQTADPGEAFYMCSDVNITQAGKNQDNSDATKETHEKDQLKNEQFKKKIEEIKFSLDHTRVLVNESSLQDRDKQDIDAKISDIWNQLNVKIK